MVVLRETYFIYRRNFKTWITQPMNAVAPLLSSAFIFLFFGAPLGEVTELPGFPAQDYEAFLTGMIIVMTMVFSGGDVAMALLTDMLSGYFEKLLLAPINRFSILMGMLLIAGTRAFAQVVVIVLIATALGVTFEGGLVAIVAIILAATLFGITMACVGLIIALKTRSAQVTMNSWLLFMPLAFLTTAFMPRELLTGWFKVAVIINPVDYIMAAMRVVIIEGWEWDTILPGVWALVGMTVVVMATATWFYQRVTA